MLKKILLGNKKLQKIWWKLFRLALKGMNYDRGHVPTANGEIFALHYVISNFPDGEKITLFDVGANRGQYLTMASQQGGQRLEIFSFEPQSSAFEYLSKKAVAINNAHIENIGFGAKKETVILYKDSEASEFASIYPAHYDQYNVNLTIKEEIRLDTIDSYCGEHHIGRIHFLKLDVEGHEIAALSGAAKMIEAGKIDFIQFEFGMASVESRTFIKDFFRILPGYTIYRILPKGLEKLVYSEYAELFLTTNYLAVLNKVK